MGTQYLIAKFQRSALQIAQESSTYILGWLYWVECMTSSHLHILHIFQS